MLRRCGAFVEHGKNDLSPTKGLMRWAKRDAKARRAINVEFYWEPASKGVLGVMGWKGEIEWPPI